MFSLPLHLFPTNGLDRSLHAPVVIGLVLVTFFTEAFGWTYAGLVVPGYLAATFAAAPVTACLVLFEALLTHWGVLLIASVIPRRTGAWSTAFGRERFFLYIVIAVIVRLAIEGSLVPWASSRWPLSHSRELYSIGLVLVPLVANVFWSAGVVHTGPRLAVVTAITYFIVTRGLLAFTNFSLSRFEVANESVALHFLDTSKAYLLLLTGALLGARGNVRYGWDYNGILVPALLAVAWYEPTKLLGTALEAVAIYLLARFLASVPPFSRTALVGSRRMLFVGVMGFLVKLGMGHLLMHWAPQIQLTEYLGFGYILPSLLAIKMWNKSAIGIVLMPTLHVSLMAFVVGNALGFGLNWIMGSNVVPPALAAELGRVDSAAFELLLASTEPARRPGECVPSVESARLLEVVQQSFERGEVSALDVAVASQGALRVAAGPSGWFVIAPEPSHQGACQNWALALAPRHAQAGSKLLIQVPPSPNGASAVVSALALAEATRAPLVQVLATGELATDPVTRRGFWRDAGYASSTLRVGTAPEAHLRVRGTIPPALDLAALERALGQRVVVDWVGGAEGELELALGQDQSESLATSVLGAAELAEWSGPIRRELSARVDQLLAPVFEAPRIEELRLLSNVVLPGLGSRDAPSAWVRSVAAQLGYQIAGAGPKSDRSWVLHELESPRRRGRATWVVRQSASEPLAVEVPAPLWELGTLSLGLSLFDADQARFLLLAGARPDASPDGASDPRRAAGKHGTFQHLHEYMLSGGVRALAIHGVQQDLALATEVVLELDHPVLSAEQVQPWLVPQVEGLQNEGGLSWAWYRASAEHVRLGAQFDPAFAFAQRFAPGRMARLWFSARARQAAPRLPASEGALLQLRSSDAAERDVAARTFELLECQTPGCSRQRSSGCDLDAVVAGLERWLARRNPFDRVAAVSAGSRCHFEADVDQRSGMAWAIVSDPSGARLVPLHGARVGDRRSRPLTTRDAVRRAIDWGTATLIVEPP
ncbi:MAG: poly-gamma-glutamate biosynthesis protein PgsC/CapC [Deltaproteobacteria bacterium]